MEDYKIPPAKLKVLDAIVTILKSYNRDGIKRGGTIKLTEEYINGNDELKQYVLVSIDYSYDGSSLKGITEIPYDYLQAPVKSARVNPQGLIIDWELQLESNWIKTYSSIFK